MEEKEITKWIDENIEWVMSKILKAQYLESCDIDKMQIFKTFKYNPKESKSDLLLRHVKEIAYTAIFGEKIEIDYDFPVRTINGFYSTYGRLPTKKDRLTILYLHKFVYFEKPMVELIDPDNQCVDYFMSEFGFIWNRPY